MRSFLGRDILTLKDFSREDFFRVFEVANELRPHAANRRNGDLLKDKILLDGLLPAEHSNPPVDRGGHAPAGRARARLQRREDDPRRRLLPGVAQGHLPDARELRRRDRDPPLPGGRAGGGGKVVVGTGDQLRRRLGPASHPGPHRPVHTILLERGTLDGLSYLLVGDMRMRTMHSILHALSQFDAEAIVVSPPEMALKPEFKAELDA